MITGIDDKTSRHDLHNGSRIFSIFSYCINNNNQIESLDIACNTKTKEDGITTSPAGKKATVKGQSASTTAPLAVSRLYESSKDGITASSRCQARG